jgi:hypothetical protein
MCFVKNVVTNSDLCHLHKKVLVFITEIKSVYSAVRTGPLNEAVCAPSIKGCDNLAYHNTESSEAFGQHASDPID